MHSDRAATLAAHEWIRRIHVNMDRMRRHYSDAERARGLEALRANGGKVNKTAHELGVPSSTLRHWRDTPTMAAPAATRDEQRQALTDLLEEWARAALSYGLAWLRSGPPLDSRNIRSVMVGMGIAVDKLVLLRRREAGTKPDDLASPPVDRDSVLTDLESLLSQPAMRALLMAALLAADADEDAK